MENDYVLSALTDPAGGTSHPILSPTLSSHPLVSSTPRSSLIVWITSSELHHPLEPLPLPLPLLQVETYLQNVHGMLSYSMARLEASQHTLSAMRAGEETSPVKSPVYPTAPNQTPQSNLTAPNQTPQSNLTAPSQLSQSNLTTPSQRVTVMDGLHFRRNISEDSAKDSARGSSLTMSSGHSERERIDLFMALDTRRYL